MVPRVVAWCLRGIRFLNGMGVGGVGGTRAALWDHAPANFRAAVFGCIRSGCHRGAQVPGIYNEVSLAS